MVRIKNLIKLIESNDNIKNRVNDFCDLVYDYTTDSDPKRDKLIVELYEIFKELMKDPEHSNKRSAVGKTVFELDILREKLQHMTDTRNEVKNMLNDIRDKASRL